MKDLLDQPGVMRRGWSQSTATGAPSRVTVDEASPATIKSHNQEPKSSVHMRLHRRGLGQGTVRALDFEQLCNPTAAEARVTVDEASP